MSFLLIRVLLFILTANGFYPVAVVQQDTARKTTHTIKDTLHRMSTNNHNYNYINVKAKVKFKLYAMKGYGEVDV
jgi:hypothetical protein